MADCKHTSTYAVDTHNRIDCCDCDASWEGPEIVKLQSENEKLKASLAEAAKEIAKDVIELTALRAERDKLKTEIERHINLRTQDIANLQATQSNKERLKRMYAELEAERDELVSGLEYILTMDRTKGYPTGVEWGILVSRIKGFLSKHPKRGDKETT